jgi:hypothetical protein
VGPEGVQKAIKINWLEISGTSEYSNLFQCFSMLLSRSEVPQSTKPTH